ncbi:MAG TPA: hypothetical protein VNZ01_05640 [Solirubrobacteraceae bacterium]|jgi:hypothetical protein|nr:hypothetical protein [Solirubrobacteraceae bacterium]
MRRLSTICSAATVALLAGAAPAGADVFGPISLVSTNALQQADYAHDPAISGDGRYVAFDGSLGGVTGVWRREVSSKTVEQVAGGDATLPSISQDGRYVSFTTTEQLVPGDGNASPDVYVRDMSLPAFGPCKAGEEVPRPCPYRLASAVNKPEGAPSSEEALSYQTSEPTRYGSVAAGRSALSADGRYVAFVTTAVSNLANPNRAGSETVETPETPALQVAVRDLLAGHTELASPLYEPATGSPAQNAAGLDLPVPGGAVYSGAAAFPSAFQGASLSADGSTVAWLGESISAQAAALPSDNARVATYTEPLWRRVADGPHAITRRVTGGSDPASAQCATSGETQLVQPRTLADPCGGPFDTKPIEPGTPPEGVWTLGNASNDFLPRLSADGSKVAFLANARLIAGGEEFNHAEASDDLYLADMRAGLTRTQALRRLTAIASGEVGDVARNAPIFDLGISPDGNQVAFSSRRTVFPLGSPAFVSVPAAVPGMRELYSADLANDTLTRVTRGFERETQASEEPHGEVPAGEDPYSAQEGAASVSFTSNGATLAFASSASNLVYGDGNAPKVKNGNSPIDGSDAFVVSREVFAPTPTEGSISSAPAGPAITPLWRLGVTAASRPDGSVVLYVTLPGAGRLQAAARGSVPLSARSARRSKRSRAGRRASTRGVTPVAVRTVATSAVGSSAGGSITLTLRLARAFTSLADQRGGLSSTVNLTFTAAGQATLHDSIPVTFQRTAHAARHRSRTSKAGKRRSR